MKRSNSEVSHIDESNTQKAVTSLVTALQSVPGMPCTPEQIDFNCRCYTAMIKSQSSNLEEFQINIAHKILDIYEMKQKVIQNSMTATAAQALVLLDILPTAATQTITTTITTIDTDVVMASSEREQEYVTYDVTDSFAIKVPIKILPDLLPIINIYRHHNFLRTNIVADMIKNVNKIYNMYKTLSLQIPIQKLMMMKTPKLSKLVDISSMGTVVSLVLSNRKSLHRLIGVTIIELEKFSILARMMNESYDSTKHTLIRDSAWIISNEGQDSISQLLSILAVPDYFTSQYAAHQQRTKQTQHLHSMQLLVHLVTFKGFCEAVELEQAIDNRIPLAFQIQTQLFKSGIEPNPGPVVLDGIKISFQNQSKEQRALYIQRQKDEKNKSNVKTYVLTFSQLDQKEKGQLTGDQQVDFSYFNDLLIANGYASKRLLMLPSYIIQDIFAKYVQGYGLQHYEKILRKFNEMKGNTYGISIDNRTPEPGEEGRRLLVKFFFRLHKQKYPFLTALLCSYKNQMFEGILSKVGSSIAKGFKEEIMPIWDTIIKKLADVKDSALQFIQQCGVFLSIFVVAIIIGVVGWQMVSKYGLILFEKPVNPEGSLENQMLETAQGLVTFTFTSWIDYFGKTTDQFIGYFNDAHLGKGVEKLGKLSSAFNNIYNFLEKMTKMIKYVIDISWKWITGVPFFESTKRVNEICLKVNELIATVRVDDIMNKGADQRIKFVQAFQDIVEMAPFIGRFDKALHTSINMAVATATPVYLQCVESIRHVDARQKPIWIYLHGPPDQGKSALSFHLARLLFDYLKVHHKDIWLKIGKENFNMSLIYPRQSEQEYWDRYANQWVCTYDDLLQQKDEKGTEVFSLIRAKGELAYPLHMASLARKENTSFVSKVIISSTNATEDYLKSLSGLVDYRAFCRRRDFVVRVMLKDGTKRTDNIYDPSILENYSLEVCKVQGMSGECTMPEIMEGLDGVKKLVELMAIKYVTFHYAHTQSSKIPELPQDFWTKKPPLISLLSKVAELKVVTTDTTQQTQLSKLESLIKATDARMKTENPGILAFELQTIINQAAYNGFNTKEVDVLLQEKLAEARTIVEAAKLKKSTRGAGVFPKDDDSDNEYSDADDASTTASSHTASTSTSSEPWESQCWSKKKEDQIEMSFLHRASYFPRKLHHNFIETFNKLVHRAYSKIDEVREYIKEMRKIDPYGIFADWRFDGYFEKYGMIVAKNTEWAKNINLNVFLHSYIRWRLGDSKVFETTGSASLCEITNSTLGTDYPRHYFQNYIGLSNPLYFSPHRDKIIEMAHRQGYTMLTYDLVKAMGVQYSDQFQDTQFFQEHPYAAEYLRYKGESKIITELSFIKKALVAMTLGIGAAIGIVHIIRSMFPQFANQSNAKYLEKLKRETAKRPITWLGKAGQMKSQTNDVYDYKSQFCDEQTRAIVPTIAHNIYMMEAETVDGSFYSQYATGLTSNLFVCAAHMFEIPNITTFKFYPTFFEGNAVGIHKADVKFMFVAPKDNRSQRDLVLFQLPGMNYVRTITQHLPKRGEIYDQVEGFSRIDKLESISKTTGRLFTLDDKGEPVEATEAANFILVPGISPTAKIAQHNVGDKQVSLIDCYKFHILHCTLEGDCGKPYLWFNPTIQKKIMGFHVAGMSIGAVASPLYIEDVQDFEKQLKETSTAYQNQFRQLTMDLIENHLHPDDDIIVEQQYSQSLMGMPQVAKIKNKSFSYPRKTKLIATPLVKESFTKIDGKSVLTPPPFPVKTAPAKLSPGKIGDQRMDPEIISLRQFKDKVNFYTRHFRMRELYDGIFNAAINSCSGRFLTKAQAVKGVIGWLHSHSFPRNSSMAFPYQSEGSKAHFILTDISHFDALPLSDRGRFRQIGPSCWIDYRIDDLVDMWFEAVRNGKIPPNVVLFCLKDEPRDLERVAMFKTRAFFMGALVLMIVTRMVFGDFINVLETYNDSSDSAVGVNPYSAEWTLMYKHLTEFGFECVDDDVSGFDIRFPVTSFVDGFPEMYCKQFSISANTFESACVYACTYSNLAPHVVLGNMIFIALFMSSGNLVTCIFNTIENSIENRAIIKEIIPTEHFNTIARQKCFGDDIIQVIKPEFHDRITRHEIRRIAKLLFGHERTDSMKSTTDKSFNDIHDAFFLQRQFKPVSSGVLSPLNIESIHTMLHWIMKPKDKTVPAQFKINVDEALMELTRHGEAKFTIYKKILNGYLAEYGSSYVYNHSYEEMYIDMIARLTSPH